MGLSFILKELVGASSLQAFAAGAALSATSLGTTFTILSTTNLIATRLGTVTTSAAMLDDVIGLVMVQIISNLGGNGSSFDAMTVIRPLFVSFGFAVGLFLICAFFIGPCLEKVLRANSSLPGFLKTWHFAFLFHTVLLVGIVAGATYAGTSSLFAAYLSGVIVTWLDEKRADSQAPASDAQNTSGSVHGPEQSVQSESSEQPSVHESDMPTGEKVYETYFKQPANRILIPLFFVGILVYLFFFFSPIFFSFLFMFCSCIDDLTSCAGINRVCDSYNRNVSGKCRMAWYHLFSANDFRKDDHRSLASAILFSAFLQFLQFNENPLIPLSPILLAHNDQQAQEGERPDCSKLGCLSI